MENKPSRHIFESKIKPLLIYIGTLGAIISGVAYIIAIFVLIFGFKSNMKTSQAIVYAVANAVFGMIIMFFLKVQGKDFARNEEENKVIHKAYYGEKTKDKKIRSMKYFWIKSTLTDFVFKALSVVASTTLMIKIVIDANGDLALLGLAVANLLLFFCFGLLSLVKAYDFYNDYQIPYMKEELKKIGKELKIEPKNDTIIEEKKV